MQKALLVNDDGYKAAGLRALYKELENKYDVTAIAPANEQSWKGKSITGVGELTLEKVEYHEFKGYSLTGTPADCTQIGMYELLHEKPYFVISGINHGANIGHAYILSSGTIGAALEAALQGIPAFASSVYHFSLSEAFQNAEGSESARTLRIHADITHRVIEKIMNAGCPAGIQVVSINLPYNVQADAPWVVTRPHRMHYGAVFTGDGQKFTVAQTSSPDDVEDLETDLAALIKGYVSIAPLRVELTSDADQQALADILGIPIAGHKM